MIELQGLLAGEGTRLVTGDGPASLLRRVVESQAVMRPGRYALYLGRPDPSQVRVELPALVRLASSARRTTLVTPSTAPVPAGVEWRDPGLGWLAPLWFSAVLGPDSAMAVVADEEDYRDRLWLVTDPVAVRRFVAAVESELARPDPQLLAV